MNPFKAHLLAVALDVHAGADGRAVSAGAVPVPGHRATQVDDQLNRVIVLVM